MEKKADNRVKKWTVGIIKTLTALYCVIFLFLAFEMEILEPMAVFHLAGELFSMIICILLEGSFDRAVSHDRLQELTGASYAFRVFRAIALALYGLMFADVTVWLAARSAVSSMPPWRVEWYIIPMALLALGYAGMFQWMISRSRKLETSFRRLMSENVATELIGDDNGAGQMAYVTVLFCQAAKPERNLRKDGASGGAAEEDPNWNRFLRMFYSEAAEICEKHGGTALEFPGECVLCVFGAPEPLVLHEASAVEAALEITDEMRALDRLRRQTKFPPVSISIGINTGNAHVGNVGDEKQKRFTVIGSSVNLASRIGSYAKPWEILISENVHKAVSEYIAAEEVGKIMPKGFDEPVAIFRVDLDGGIQ